MSVIKAVKNFFRKYVFSLKWRCNDCGKEVFDGEYFCEECREKLPFNDGKVCNHCGRKTVMPTEYCSTCKDRLVSVDKCRSVFVYEKPVSSLIKKGKYYGARYVWEMFADYLSTAYFKNYFNSDVICFVPMSKRAMKKRKYNHCRILADELSMRIGVPVADVLEKKRETVRQAELGKKGRLINLKGLFAVNGKKAVKDKSVLLIDDVTTTGSTVEAVAETLKKAGAKTVNVLTVASVPSKDGY